MDYKKYNVCNYKIIGKGFIMILLFFKLMLSLFIQQLKLVVQKFQNFLRDYIYSNSDNVNATTQNTPIQMRQLK